MLHIPLFQHPAHLLAPLEIHKATLARMILIPLFGNSHYQCPPGCFCFMPGCRPALRSRELPLRISCWLQRMGIIQFTWTPETRAMPHDRRSNEGAWWYSEPLNTGLDPLESRPPFNGCSIQGPFPCGYTLQFVFSSACFPFSVSNDTSPHSSINPIRLTPFS